MINPFSDYGGYANGGGGMGGGYEDQQQGGYLQGGSQGDATAGFGAGSSGKKGSTPLHLTTTIRAVLKAPHDTDNTSVLVENKGFSRVLIMGKVSNVKAKETAKTLTLDDGTGSITVQIWANDDDPPLVVAQRQSIQDGIYAKCYGAPRRFNNEWTINSFYMAPIKDFNELTHHFLESMFVRLQLEKGPINTSLASKGFSPSEFGGVGGGHNTFGVPISAAANSMNNPNALSGNPKLVHDLFAQDHSTEEGYSISFVADKLKARGLTLAQIVQICNGLVNEGHLYTTVDDDHFKSTGTFV